MKKQIFTLMLAAVVCGASPVFAMETENEKIDIRAITPIKNGMNSEQRKGAIESFLKEPLKSEYEFKTAEISSKQSRQCGGVGRIFQTYTLNDRSEWVIGTGGLNRFLGHLYLKKAIEHYDLKTLCVVETRFAYRNSNSDITISIRPSGQDGLKNIPVIDSMDFFSLSRYVGDERLTFEDCAEDNAIRNELSILRRKIGFTDIDGYTNLRKKDGKIYIIDTEYGSFTNLFEPYFDGSGDLTFTFPK